MVNVANMCHPKLIDIYKLKRKVMWKPLFHWIHTDYICSAIKKLQNILFCGNVFYKDPLFFKKY